MYRISLVILVLLFSCSTKDAPEQSLNRSLIESTFYSIQPMKDTVLETPKGARISIAAGTFDSKEAVELEIKEIYSMADILLAGMVTESDGKPLWSGGMIYINNKGGTSLKLNKPISISMPAASSIAGMKLYKGSEGIDGKINWIDPGPLSFVSNRDTSIVGELLFNANCRSCHYINLKSVGPALAGIEKRVPNRPLLRDYIRNNVKVVASGDPYFKKMSDYSPSAMSTFEQLSDQEIDAILDFVKQKVGDTTYDNKVRGELLEAWNSKIKSDSIAEISNLKNLPDPPMTESEMMEGLIEGFTDQLISDGRYLFEIETLGWYNVDAEFEGLPGTSLCSLKVKLNATFPLIDGLNVYLFIPEQKSLSVGQPKQNGIYHFEKIRGMIPLQLGDKAFVIAFGNQKEQFYYGITGFVTKSEQVIEITLREIGKEEFLKQVRQLQFEGIQFQLK